MEMFADEVIYARFVRVGQIKKIEKGGKALNRYQYLSSLWIVYSGRDYSAASVLMVILADMILLHTTTQCGQDIG